MKIQDIREQVLKSFITRELLEDSVYPSLALVCSILLRDYEGIDAARTLLEEKHNMSVGESASADKMNEILKYTKIDLETLYKFTDYLESYLTGSKNSAINKIEALAKMTTDLKVRVQSLLMENSDVSSLAEVIAVDFHTPEIIDLVMTNAFIDYGKGYAQSRSSKNVDPVDLGKVYKDIIVTPITQGYISFRTAVGTSLDSLLADNSAMWTQEMIMPDSYNGIAEISLKISLKDKTEMNRLQLSFGSSNIGDIYSIALVARVEGLYERITDYTDFRGFADISFKSITTDYIILNIRQAKKTFDTTRQSRYKFSLSEIAFSKTQFEDSSVIELKETAGKNLFSMLALDADETIADGLDIQYEASLRDSTTKQWTDYETIAPINRKIDLKKYTSIEENSESIYPNGAVDLTFVHPYLYAHNFGTSFELSSLELANIEILKPIILRNTNGFRYASDRSNLIEVSLVIKDIQLTLDFGQYPGYLNNGAVNSLTTLDKGIYSFKFNANNGAEKYRAYFLSLPADSFAFGSAIAGYIAEEDFLNRIEDDKIEYFTVTNIDGKNIVILKSMTGNLYPQDTKSYDEKLIMITKNVNTQTRADMFKLKVTLKAIKDQSPILKQINIKLG